MFNGTKRYINSAIHAGLLTVLARTAPKEAGVSGISAFLVERDTPGFTVAKPHRKMGFHGSHESDVIFEDCRVPAGALLGGCEGGGFRSAMQSLDHARIHMTTEVIATRTTAEWLELFEAADLARRRC